MKDRRQLYNDFLKAFPVESLKDMTLEQPVGGINLAHT